MYVAVPLAHAMVKSANMEQLADNQRCDQVRWPGRLTTVIGYTLSAAMAAVAMFLIVSINAPLVCAVLVIAAPFVALEVLRAVVRAERFSLRALLIVTTLIAFLLGTVAYLRLW